MQANIQAIHAGNHAESRASGIVESSAGDSLPSIALT